MSKHDRDENSYDEAPLQQSIKRLKLETGQDVGTVRPPTSTNSISSAISANSINSVVSANSAVSSVSSNPEFRSTRRPYQASYEEYVPVNSLLHQLHLERLHRMSQRSGNHEVGHSTNDHSMDVSD